MSLTARLHWYYTRLLGALARPAGLQVGWQVTPESQLRDLTAIDTVIDVGVADGTGFLERAFPTARFLLFEPNPRFHPGLNARLSAHPDWKLFPCALGSAPGTACLGDKGLASSLIGSAAQPATHQVRVDTLDNVLAAEQTGSGCLLKIDTEGYELEVLRGATATLDRAQAVILELRLQGIDTYHPAEAIDLLHRHGLRLTRVLHAAARPHGFSYIDVLFTRQPAAA